MSPQSVGPFGRRGWASCAAISNLDPEGLNPEKQQKNPQPGRIHTNLAHGTESLLKFLAGLRFRVGAFAFRISDRSYTAQALAVVCSISGKRFSIWALGLGELKAMAGQPLLIAYNVCSRLAFQDNVTTSGIHLSNLGMPTSTSILGVRREVRIRAMPLSTHSSASPRKLSTDSGHWHCAGVWKPLIF